MTNSAQVLIRVAGDEEKMLDYAHRGCWRHTHGDGRLFGEFRQIGTKTGRMLERNPNLQNLPKADLRVRYCIAAAEGNVLVAADLDAVEMRVLSCYAPGGTLAQAFAQESTRTSRPPTSLGSTVTAARHSTMPCVRRRGATLRHQARLPPRPGGRAAEAVEDRPPRGAAAPPPTRGRGQTVAVPADDRRQAPHYFGAAEPHAAESAGRRWLR